MAKAIFLLLYTLALSPSYAHEITSPNKKIKVIVTMQLKERGTGQPYFKVLYKQSNSYVEVLPLSPLGILRKDQQFVSNLRQVGETRITLIQQDYEMCTGKRKSCKNYGAVQTLKYLNSSNQPLDVTFQVYNNGVAFRYTFPNQSDTTVSITDEATAYAIPTGTSRWMQPFQSSYEDFYSFNTTGTDKKNSREWGYPALFKVNEVPLWMLLTESGITSQNCGARLNNQKDPDLYKVSYPPAKKNWHSGVVETLPWKSQWHVIIVGSLADLVESTLVNDVAEPTVFKDTGWIKPGSASWVYWAYNHGSKDYKKVIEYIDLATRMNWPYILIDWEWDVMSNGGNLNDAMAYAKSKGIKVLLWYNSGTDWLGATPADRLLTPDKRKKEFTWLNQIGVSGIKVDFFAGDQQDMIKYYIDILEDAAKFHLLVNFHGATVPRGWARTYPNLVTTEAVYGAEWYNNDTTLTNKAAVHNSTLPFTRNVVGSMDYTPVTFSNSQHKHITTFAHELALAVVFESGLQHFADRPSAYYAVSPECQHFLKNFPTTWDRTRLLAGYPGEGVILARKKGKCWYVAGINGKSVSQTLSFRCDFLHRSTSVFQLFKDGKNGSVITNESITIKKGEALSIPCLPQGGFSGIIYEK